MTTTERDSLQARIAARQDEMRADLARYVAIPTGGDHRAGLDEFRGLLGDRLAALGVTSDLRAGDERPDWLLNAGAGEPLPTIVHRCAGFDEMTGPRVLIAGHLDTVFPPGSSFNEMTVSTDGRTAIGPGVVDMKGGLLVACVALEALAEAGIPVRWSFLMNSDEETGTYCSERHLRDESSRHDVGIALEPALPGGELAIQRKGSGQFSIAVDGRCAHAGREFEKGVSAVYALAHVLTKVETFSDLDRGVTVNVGPLVGGSATNVVPPHAQAWGNARFPDPESGDALQDKLAALADDGDDGDDAMPRVRVMRSFNRPAKPLIPETERFALLAREAAESLGQSLPFASTGGVCDGNVMQDAGLPTIDTLGVRGGGLHTHDERIELDSLHERAALLACLLASLDERWNP